MLKVVKAGDSLSGVMDMENNQIAYVTEPVNKEDAVTKNYFVTFYVAVRTYWTIYGTTVMPTADNTTIILYQFHDDKTITNDKVTLLKLWVERETNTYFDASSGSFNSAWTRISTFVNSDGRCVYFTGHSASWSGRYIIQYIVFQ